MDNITNLSKVDDAVNKFGKEHSSLIPILHEIQKSYGYLPEDCIKHLGKELKIPLSRIYGVITFYAQFHLTKRGRNIIRVCNGTACHVRGEQAVLKAIKECLKIEENQTTPDNTFTLETVACLGSCALAPVMLINDNYYGKTNPKMIEIILKQYAEGDSVET